MIWKKPRMFGYAVNWPWLAGKPYWNCGTFPALGKNFIQPYGIRWCLPIFWCERHQSWSCFHIHRPCAHIRTARQRMPFVDDTQVCFLSSTMAHLFLSERRKSGAIYKPNASYAKAGSCRTIWRHEGVFRVIFWYETGKERFVLSRLDGRYWHY